MRRDVSLTIVLLFVLLAVAQPATAEVPNQMNYQGQLTDDLGAPLDTVVSMTFTIYDDSSGGVVLWTETQTGVQVSDGLFDVLLGSAPPIPDTVFADDWTWLGIQIGSDPEIAPLTKLVTVPYAFRVATVDGASGGSVFGKLHAVTGGSETSVYGENTTSDNVGSLGGGSFGVYGQNDTDSSRHFGYLGGEQYGVYGEDTLYGTHGFLGRGSAGAGGYQGDGYDDNFALLGYHNAGVYAWSPGEDAVFAYTDSGVAFNAVAIHGTAAEFGAPEDADLIVFRTVSTDRFSIAAHSSGPDYLSVRSKFENPDNDIIVFRGDGKVGVGTTSPENLLSVTGAGDDNGGVAGYNEVTGYFKRNAAGHSAVSVDAQTGQDPIVYLAENGNAMWSLRSDTDDLNKLQLRYHGGVVQQQKFITVDTLGFVGIGTTSPGYMLDVDGDINVSGSYNVKRGGTDYDHPDYVFEPDYELMSLGELRKYVFEKKSLPNVISAEDVKRDDGFSMDELLVQMLEKIEEQTLYIFELEDRIAKLEKERRTQTP